MPKITSLPVLAPSSYTSDVIFPVVDVNVEPGVTKIATLGLLASVIPNASTTTKGLVKIGDGLAATNGTISLQLPTASPSVLGGIKIGENLTIDGEGIVSAAASGYSGASRTSISVTTDVITAGTKASTVVTGFKGYALYNIEVSAAAWITIYSSTTARDSDVGRSISTDPTPGSGVIAEIITIDANKQYFSPALVGYSSEEPPTTDIPLSVYNNSGSDTAITVTVTYLQLEV